MDYGSSPYATLSASGLSGGAVLGKQRSFARQNSLRNSTGSIASGAGSAGSFSFQAAASAPRPGHTDVNTMQSLYGGGGGGGVGASQQRAGYGTSPGRPSSALRPQSSGAGMGAGGGRVSNSGGTPLYSSTVGGPSVGPGRRPSNPGHAWGPPSPGGGNGISGFGGYSGSRGSSGYGSPASPGSPYGKKIPVSERISHVKAVYNAAKFSRSLEDMLRGGTSANRPEARSALGAVMATRGSGGGGSTGGRPTTPTRSAGQRPVGFTCYLCGQQYGSQSLYMHIPQCQKKWVMVESQKPRNEQRPLPPPPPELDGGALPTRAEDIQEFNSRMYGYWDKVSLVGCPICARTFRPDAFEKHAKVCTPQNPGGPLGPNKHAPPPSARPTSARPTSAMRSGGGGGSGGGFGGSGGGFGGGSTAGRPTTPSRAPGQRPIGFTCYLCGQQYGSQSLYKHIPQCQKKWVMVESQKPRKEQRPLPPPPPELDGGALPTRAEDIQEFNSRMYGYWDKVSLVGCPICARTFRPDAFERHAKVCTPQNPGGPLGPNKHAKPGGGPAAPGAGGGTMQRPTSAMRGGGGGGGGARPSTPPRREGERPRAYVCYLCGQQFGSQSLAIHVPQCYEKWLRVESNKPPKERRAPPPAPPELDEPLPTRPDEIDEFNSKMFAYYNGVSLMPCPHCGRTMRPEALRAHSKACTAEKPMGRQGAGAGGGGGAGAARAAGYGAGAGAGGGMGGGEYVDNSAELEPCGNCGRKMRPEALAKHQKVCTPDKPMKPAPPPGRPAAPAAAGGAGQSPRRKDNPGNGAAGASGGGGGGGAGGGRPPPPPAAAPAEPQGYTEYESDGEQEERRPQPGGIAPRSQQQQQQEEQQEEQADDGGDEGAYDAGGGANGQYDDGGGDYGGDYGGDDGDERVQCGTCGRRFMPDALAKHSRVCAKVFAGKRKVFNSAAKRVAGTEAAAYVNPRATAAAAKPAQRQAAAAAPAGRAGGAAGAGGGGGGKGGAAAPAWKQKSESLRQAMAQMRQVNRALAAGQDLRDIPYVPSGPDPSLVQCPCCGRRFNAQAAERHIPKCGGISAKPKFLKAGTGGAGRGAPDSKPLPKW